MWRNNISCFVLQNMWLTRLAWLLLLAKEAENAISHNSIIMAPVVLECSGFEYRHFYDEKIIELQINDVFMTECHNILQQDCMPPTRNYYSYIVTMTTQDRPMEALPLSPLILYQIHHLLLPKSSPWKVWSGEANLS